MFGLEIINSVVFTRTVALDLTNHLLISIPFLGLLIINKWSLYNSKTFLIPYMNYFVVIIVAAWGFWYAISKENRKSNLDKIKRTPSLDILLDSFEVKIYENIDILFNTGFTNCAGKNVQNGEYNICIKPDAVKERKDYIWFNNKFKVRFLSNTKCNEIKIQKINLFYGNSEKTKRIQHTYIIAPEANLMKSTIVNNDLLILQINLIERRYFEEYENNNEDILGNTNNGIYIELDISFFEIDGTEFKGRLKYDYCWNDSPNIKKYLLINQAFEVNP
jgi:hypothetical protein